MYNYVYSDIDITLLRLKEGGVVCKSGPPTVFKGTIIHVSRQLKLYSIFTL